MMTMMGIDIDGNDKYDALTDGLLLLRGMFGLDGSALITGTVASDAIFTASVAIENRIKILGDLSDIDGNGITDALTDGLLTLRYLFGLEGDTLIRGVVAGGATRTSAEEIETYLAMLMPSIKSTNESNPPELSDLTISTTSVDVSSSSQDITFSLKVKDESGVTYYPGAGEAAIYPSGFSADQMSAVNDWVLKSGDNKDGVWEITITVPQGQLSGNYYFSTGSFRDANGSSSACNSNGSYCGGPYPLIAVDNGLETNPPELSDLTISTTSVDVSSSSQDITFSLKVKDESGVTYYPGAGEAAIYPSGFSADQMSAVNDWVLKSGDNKDGVWEITITVPQGQLSGNYYFSTGSFRDANGSSSACNSNGSYCGGPYPLIAVDNGLETNPPELSDLTISTTSVDVSSSSQDITFSLKVKDESGVTYYPGAGEAAIYPSGFSADQMSAVNDWVLKSGDNKDGVWEITITVPQGQLSGNYYFSTGSFRDANGSSSACNSNGSYCGGPYPLIAVDNGLETNPPELSDLTISTTSVDVSSSSQDITFSLKVKDESGVTYYPGAGEAAIYPSGFSADQMSAVNDWVLKSGDNKDGVWEITITVPQGQLSGNYYFSTGSFRDANGSSSACNSNGSYCGGPYPLIVISS